MLAVATFVTAVVAAVYWFRSAALEVEGLDQPTASITDAIEKHTLTAVVNMNLLHKAMNESARLNRSAAIWTGVSALLAASQPSPASDPKAAMHHPRCDSCFPISTRRGVSTHARAETSHPAGLTQRVDYAFF